jgi:hypothetical protein
MRCIYCLEDSSASKGRAHVFPEALKHNSDVLPVGAVCDACNNYLGELDRIVAAHPFVSLAIQFHGVPGKRRRARDRVGGIDRTVHPGGITIPCSEPIETVAPSGRRTWTVQPLLDPSFDLYRFRRGLHHIALNLVAQTDGVERVYDSSFDRAREYVRRPKPRECWDYAQYVISLEQIDNVVLGGIYKSEVDEFVGLRLFNVALFVDLLTVGRLEPFIKATQPTGTIIVGPDYATQAKRPVAGRRQYRLTIETDGFTEDVEAAPGPNSSPT